MPKHEVVNMLTGEVMEFETSVDIQLLEDYNRWVVDNKLNPPTYSPQEYALYLEAEQAKKNLSRAIEMVEKYNMGTQWSPQMLDSLLRILKDEE